MSSDNRDDQQPRACVLAFLSHLDSSNEFHQRLMEKLVSDLLEKVFLTEKEACPLDVNQFLFYIRYFICIVFNYKHLFCFMILLIKLDGFNFFL